MNLRAAPTALSSQIRPPCSSTNRRAIVKSEPSAVMLPRRRRIDLRELLEHERLVLRRDADARVTDLDHVRRAPRRHACHARTHTRPPLRRELDRVADEIA